MTRNGCDSPCPKRRYFRAPNANRVTGKAHILCEPDQHWLRISIYWFSMCFQSSVLKESVTPFTVDEGQPEPVRICRDCLQMIEFQEAARQRQQQDSERGETL